jgi:hypothetical protein
MGRKICISDFPREPHVLSVTLGKHTHSSNGIPFSILSIEKRNKTTFGYVVNYKVVGRRVVIKNIVRDTLISEE